MWLVQRCKPKVKIYTDELVSKYMDLDYMGSAEFEFEFGTIPKSIRKLAGSNLVQSSFKVTNNKHHVFTVSVLADENDMVSAKEAIQKYLDGKAGARRLKEWISLGQIIDESDHGKEYISDTFWWCVDENLTFCFSLDPEQCRCFKLALAKSLAFMDAEKAKEDAHCVQ